METFAFTAFAVALLGGGHCLAMCGGIVAAASGTTVRVGITSQLAYHVGRLSSYAVAGAAAGALGMTAAASAGILPAQMVLFVVANALVVLLGLYLAGWGRFVRHLESAGAALWRIIAPVGRRMLPADTPAKAVALGMVWGWLPCGLVYGALALALVSGGAMQGGLVMLAFGIGTLPVLLTAGLLAGHLHRALRRASLRAVGGVLVMALGVAGLARIPGLAAAVREGWLCAVSI